MKVYLTENLNYFCKLVKVLFYNRILDYSEMIIIIFRLRDIWLQNRNHWRVFCNILLSWKPSERATPLYQVQPLSRECLVLRLKCSLHVGAKWLMKHLINWFSFDRGLDQMIVNSSEGSEV